MYRYDNANQTRVSEGPELRNRWLKCSTMGQMLVTEKNQNYLHYFTNCSNFAQLKNNVCPTNIYKNRSEKIADGNCKC